MSLIGILLLYTIIGAMAAIGTVTITQQRFSLRTEKVFISLLLLPVAAIYLAFVDYYQSPAALRLELWGIGLFVLLGLLGTRITILMVLGYFLHGCWDLGHEILGLREIPSGTNLTPIPLAYGVFCAAYYWCIAGYILKRRSSWAGDASR